MVVSIVVFLESKGTGSDDGGGGNTVLEEVLGNVSASGSEVGLLELAVSNGVNGGRDSGSELLFENRLRDGQSRVVLENRAGHLVGDGLDRLALGTTGVAADEVGDQRADCRASSRHKVQVGKLRMRRRTFVMKA